MLQITLTEIILHLAQLQQQLAAAKVEITVVLVLLLGVMEVLEVEAPITVVLAQEPLDKDTLAVLELLATRTPAAAVGAHQQ
jgi:hypothetical protein